MSTTSVNKINWLLQSEQQFWFNKLKSNDEEIGFKFNKFQEFLNETIYSFINKNLNEKNYTNLIKSKISEDEIKFTYQQELKLFKLFDIKNDHIIDRDEFSLICNNWLHKIFNFSAGLVIVDVQNDFIDGSLALINGPAEQDGADVVPIINQLLDNCSFQAIVYTQDWHPIDHIGFHDNLHLRKYSLKKNSLENVIANDDDGDDYEKNNNLDDEATSNNDNLDLQDENVKFNLKFKKNNELKVKIFDTVLFDSGKMEQKLWPTHCVQNSWGAELHSKLKIIPDSIRIYKGTLSNVDAYSAFWDNMHLNETGLRQELLSRKIEDVFFCGLALDYCVSASALDSIKAGFTTFVIEDACRGISNDEIELRKKEMLEKGIFIINSKSVCSYISLVKGKNNNICKSDSNFDQKLFLKICYRKALALNYEGN